MTFLDQETSLEGGVPFEIYEFIWGEGEANVYRYTNAERPVIVGDDTYSPVPIKREAYVAAGKTDKIGMRIEFPVTVNLAGLFIDYPPSMPVAVIIYRGHIGANEISLAWSGRVLSASKEGPLQKLTCESTLVSLKRPGARRNYQYGCPHVLFQEGCFADKDAATYEATVASTSRNSVILDAEWVGEMPVEDFAHGILQWDTVNGVETRTILRASYAEGLLLIGPIRNLKVGDPCRVVKGCDHTMVGCRKHNNILNYGGQPWIPLKNPVKYHPYW